MLSIIFVWQQRFYSHHEACHTGSFAGLFAIPANTNEYEPAPHFDTD